MKVFSTFDKVEAKRYKQLPEITQRQFSMGTRENRFQISEKLHVQTHY